MRCFHRVESEPHGQQRPRRAPGSSIVFSCHPPSSRQSVPKLHAPKPDHDGVPARDDLGPVQAGQIDLDVRPGVGRSQTPLIAR